MNIAIDPNLVISIGYNVLFYSFVLMSVFIVFHIIRYSYSKIGSLVMLLIFVPVVSSLLLANKALFEKIDLIHIINSLMQ